jgi:hypothetical protein
VRERNQIGRERVPSPPDLRSKMPTRGITYYAARLAPRPFTSFA